MPGTVTATARAGSSVSFRVLRTGEMGWRLQVVKTELVAALEDLVRASAPWDPTVQELPIDRLRNALAAAQRADELNDARSIVDPVGLVAGGRWHERLKSNARIVLANVRKVIRERRVRP